MKSSVFIALLAILSFVLRSQAVFVEWDKMHSEYAAVWDTGPIWDVLGGNFDRHIYFQFYFFDFGLSTLSAGAFNSDPNWLSVCVKQMSYGDVVNEANMLGQDSTYFYRSEKGEVGIHSDYDIPSASNVYLAMCTKTTVTADPYYVYGWVEICGTQVLASAWDADGGPMIVGGGSALTPEPSSALLLLVGGALLALKRRRDFFPERLRMRSTQEAR